MLVACDDENKTNNDSNIIGSAEQKNNEQSEEKNINVAKSGEIVEENNIETETSSEYTIIKFSDMYETKGKIKNVSTMLKNLDGKKVQIKGYPAVQSPLDESFVYLNNQPYVTCPFCTIGDITKLEVIPIFMADKSKIKFTENALTVYGKLEVAEKVDSENYTTQFRIYADKVEEVQDSGANKDVNDYYLNLTNAGMIYDIQTLQMNIEYVSNPEYMTYYDGDFQTGKSATLNKKAIIDGIVSEYLDYDQQYGGNYLTYINECPPIVKELEPKDSRLKGLNDDLIKLYTKQIAILEKYQKIVYDFKNLNNPTDADVENAYKALIGLNSDNLKLYNEFTSWNNKLRE